MKPSFKPLLIASGFILFFAVVIVGFTTTRRSGLATQSCRLTFLDVGQGDAILIQTADHQDVLIDGGPSVDVSRALGAYLGFGNDDIEVAILTHPDADHLTGLLAAVQAWPVTTVLTNGVVADTQLFHRWERQLKEFSGTVVPVQSGQSFQLGTMLSIEIVWPEKSWEGIPFTAKAKNGRGGINDTSVGTKITCAGSTALMIGDASDAVEQALVESGSDLHVDLLKIGHHGSKYSSAHKFLAAVHPDLAVISVGQQNRYGHPHPVVVERLNALHIPVFRTDIQGTLEFMSVPGGWRLGG